MKLSLPNNSIRPCLLALASVLILPVSASHADIITLSANLTGANEIPATPSMGTAQATVFLNTTLNTMEVVVIFSGLTSATTAAHIHCCLPSPLQNTNEPVGTTIPSFTGFPLGVTSEGYDHIFDLGADSTYNLINMPPGNPGNSFLGTSAATAEPVFVMALLNSETYLNIQHQKLWDRGDSGNSGARSCPGTRSCRGRGSAGSNRRLRWPSRLVATAAEDRLSI